MTFVKGLIPWHKGKTGMYSKETIEKMSKSRMGKAPWNKGLNKEIDSRLDIGVNYIEKRCPACNQKFTRPVSYHQIYCSKACFYRHRKKIKNIICLNCGRNFQATRPSSSPKVCSWQCHLLYHRGERHPFYIKRKSFKCDFCHKSFLKLASQSRTKYHLCSRNCLNKFISKIYRGEKHSNWKGGISFQPYFPNFRKQLKRLIRHRDGYKCQKCGCPEIENMEKLSIHHINYTKNDCNPDNLISLCNKCHGLTGENRDKWQIFFSKKINKSMDSSPIQLALKIQDPKRKRKVINRQEIK